MITYEFQAMIGYGVIDYKTNLYTIVPNIEV